MYRIGHGYDVHRFVTGKRLVIGGVSLEHYKGIEAHSDGDVLIHAVCDALLGAAALGDIGAHFPDTDVRYQGINSQQLLAQVVLRLQEANYTVVNLDATVLLEKPKLAPHIQKMRENLAGIIGVSLCDISIKATTGEKIGSIGREEGIAAHAVTLLKKGDTSIDQE